MDRIYLLVVVIASVLLTHWVVSRPFTRLSVSHTEVARFALFSSIMAVPTGFLIGLLILWHKEWGPPQFFYLGIVWPLCMCVAIIGSSVYRDVRPITLNHDRPEVFMRTWSIVIRSFPVLLLVGVGLYILVAHNVGGWPFTSTYIDN